MNYLHLIRYKNLIFIIVLMALMKYTVINPLLSIFGIESPVTAWVFWLLTAGVTLISAGGYVINDYFDTKIDSLNRPDRVIVGNSVPRERASLLFQILTGAGIACGLLTALAAWSFTLALIFILVPGLLWFYSASYKRQFLIGNVIVAFCAALVPLVVVVAENAFLLRSFSAELIKQTPILPMLYGWTCGFALFAFLTTLIREILKDMQDEYGDRESECRTMPVVWGFTKTKVFVAVITLLTMALAGFISFSLLQEIRFAENNIVVRNLFFAILIPFICILFLLFKAKRSADYGLASSVTKFTMIFGILYGILLLVLLLSINYNLPIFGFRLMPIN
ncbi:MAG: geranylgeranylglycerol-phosphate geranylgeranyltransferase [Prevotellaceae bacterium]|jgi:4-hydroxybenzoate polyprenyltransferase|nr:geranylgeranylglycerol-phosphate geranylgeranyltransferase [Prevotellaceae bacterium]